MENHLNISNQFVPYELAVKLKELGFDEECFYVRQKDCPEFLYTPTDYEDYPEAVHTEVLIPLWQQAFDWFREDFNLLSCIGFQNDYQYSYEIYDIKKKDCVDYMDKMDTYEESRLECLKKLIELCEKN